MEKRQTEKRQRIERKYERRMQGEREQHTVRMTEKKKEIQGGKADREKD